MRNADRSFSAKSGLLLHIGMWPTVALVTSCSIAASICLTTFSLWLVSAPASSWKTTLVIATVAPLAIAPVVAITLMRLVLRLVDAERRMHQLSITDGLTGVWNRRHFMALAEAEFVTAQRYGLPLSVLMVDVDHFKSINDRYGHTVGDEVLCGITAAALTSLRNADVMARYGGEEFVVLLPSTAAYDAFVAAERMREGIEAMEIAVEGAGPLRVTVSVGAATCGAPTSSVLALLDAADQALYRAKEHGRNRVECSAALV